MGKNRFQIEASFTIPGRGLSLIGDVLEGVVKKGMTFEVVHAGARLRLEVDSVESVSAASGAKVGLLVRDSEHLRGVADGQIIELE